MRRIAVVGIWVAAFVLYGIVEAHAWPWGRKAQEEAKSPEAIAEVQAPAPAPAKTEEAPQPQAEAPKAPAPEVKEEAKPAAPAPPSVDRKKLDKARAMKDRRRKAVDGNQWDVSVIAMSGKGEKAPDVLVFKENKFSSREYEKIGYPPSNYTVSITDDGNTVVETMQSNDELGILFWRVEFDKDLAGCRGVISRQISENKTEDYSFVSTAKKPAS